MKKVIRLSESELVKFIKLVSEQVTAEYDDISVEDYDDNQMISDELVIKFSKNAITTFFAKRDINVTDVKVVDSTPEGVDITIYSITIFSEETKIKNFDEIESELKTFTEKLIGDEYIDEHQLMVNTDVMSNAASIIINGKDFKVVIA
jgi:hypothetical protein